MQATKAIFFSLPAVRARRASSAGSRASTRSVLARGFALDLAQSRAWRWEYNHERPHSSLGSLTLDEFAVGLAALPVGATPLPEGQPLPS